jgi:arylsulfatase A
LTQFMLPVYAQKRPNVLLIISDDQGIGDFGFIGNKTVKSPNIDRLVKESALFEKFIVAPACSPTRSSLMTGRNHLSTGVWGVGARNNLLRDEHLIPEYFKNAGYHTGYFGKRDGVYNHEKQIWNWGCDEASHVTGYKHKDAVSITQKGNVQRKGWTCDVDVDNSLDFIKRQGDNSWWCTTAFILPHLPWIPDERFAKPYLDAGHSKTLADFYGCVTQMDDAVGRLLKGLEDLGQLDNTIVLFLSDNGPTYKNMSDIDIKSRNVLNLKGQKSTVWENGIVVPFMVRWPGKILPGLRKQFATVEDILPTLIDLAAIKPSLLDQLPFDGISLKPALMDDNAASIDRQVLRVAISFAGAAGGAKAGIRGVVNNPKEVTIEEQHLVLRGERYKYHSLVGGKTALYDIIKDPTESIDISNQNLKIKEHFKIELEKQYAKILNSGRVFQMPIVKIRDAHGLGYNKVYGAEAEKAFGINEILNEYNLKGFSAKGDNASYKIFVEKAGIYKIQVLGEDFSKESEWQIEYNDKTYLVTILNPNEIIFNTVQFDKPGLQTFSLKVKNNNKSGLQMPVVNELNFIYTKYN